MTRIQPYCLQISPGFLLSFYGFKQGLKIAFAKTFGSFPLNDLEKQGWPVFHRLGK